MEQLHHWLYSMLCCGCVCSLIMLVNPEGKTKYLLETACSCVMVLTFFAPITVNSFRITDYFDDCTVIESSSINEYSLPEAYMESEYSAYILNEAKAFGIDLQEAFVRVELDTNLNAIPYSVDYCTAQSIPDSFKEHITRTLGIPEERQTINEGSEMVQSVYQ